MAITWVPIHLTEALTTKIQCEAFEKFQPPVSRTSGQGL